MKTTILTLMTALLLVTASYSQSFTSGDKFIYAGLGLGGFQPADAQYIDPVTGNELISDNGNFRNLTFSPKFLSLDGQYFISEIVSIGPYFALSASRAEVSGNHINSNGRIGDFDGDSNNDDRFTRTRSETRSRTAFFYGIRGFAHLAHVIGLSDKWDTYAGLSIGAFSQRERVTDIRNIETTEFNFNSVNSSTSVNSSDGNSYTWRPDGGLSGNLIIGGRYFFTEQLAGGLEIGLIGTYAQINIGYKF